MEKSSFAYKSFVHFLIATLCLLSISPTSFAQTLTPKQSTVSNKHQNIHSVYNRTEQNLVGLSLDLDRPLDIGFIVKPDAAHSEQDTEQLTLHLVKYFLSALTIPNHDMWVNLSPTERQRIISQPLAQTAMGEAMLWQDFLLKETTASFLNPNETFGKTFWEKLYHDIPEIAENTLDPINIFNKVWIIPDKVTLHKDGDTVLIMNSSLKVLLEEDFSSLVDTDLIGQPSASQKTNNHVKQIVNDIIIPHIEHEVNNAPSFAKLRQIYHAMILSDWYKKEYNNTPLGSEYINQIKLSGIQSFKTNIAENVHDEYLKRFNDGVFSLIKQDYDPTSQSLVERTYFSGGFHYAQPQYNTMPRIPLPITLDASQIATPNLQFFNLSLTPQHQTKVTQIALTDPSKTEHIIGIHEPLTVELLIHTSTPIDLKNNPLEVYLQTNLYTEETDSVVQNRNETPQWHATALPVKADNIELVALPNSSRSEYIYKVTTSIQPQKTGQYEFTVKAKTQTDENFQWLPLEDQQNLKVQVDLIPSWLNRQTAQFYYLYLPDAELLNNNPLNWTTIKNFIMDRHLDTGADTFTLSPFFPTADESPFAPLSVYALSPQLVDWDTVPDQGKTPIEKYQTFMQLDPNHERRQQFERFSKDNKKLTNYIKAITTRVIELPNGALYKRIYNPDEYTNDSFANFLAYEQFINLTQIHTLLKMTANYNIHILGDIPFYRNIDADATGGDRDFFAKKNEKVLTAGFIPEHYDDFGNHQNWGDLAAWDEDEIQKQLASGEINMDPRLAAIDYWHHIFTKVFSPTIPETETQKSEIRLSGWRLDALHKFGMLPYQYGAKRSSESTALWDAMAQYFQENNLLALVEQLGNDTFAHFEFQRLSYFMITFLLDLEKKEFNGLKRHLTETSGNLRYTIAASHDSHRVPRSYLNMLKTLSGLPSNNNDVKHNSQLYTTTMPSLLALLSLGPQIATSILGLDEFATQSPIKQEIRDQDGAVVKSVWGTETKGQTDLSPWLNQFHSVRRQNPAIGNDSIHFLPINSDSAYAFYKNYQDSTVVVLGNFQSWDLNAEVTLEELVRKLNIADTNVQLRFNNATNPGWETKVIDINNPILEYHLAPGQVAILVMEPLATPSPKNEFAEWLNTTFADSTFNDNEVTALFNFVITSSTQPDYVSLTPIIETLKTQKIPITSSAIQEAHTAILNSDNANMHVWDWDASHNRVVMMHPDDGLLVQNTTPFILYLWDKNNREVSLPATFNLATQQHEVHLYGLAKGETYTITFQWPDDETGEYGWEGENYHLLVLKESVDTTSDRNIRLTKAELLNQSTPFPTITKTNGIGSINREPAIPLSLNSDGTEVLGLDSKYSGLQVNLQDGSLVPDESRRILYRGSIDDVEITDNTGTHLYPLTIDNLKHFDLYPLPTWTFEITHNQQLITITKTSVMVSGQNTLAYQYTVTKNDSNYDITLFVRPTLDHRTHHETMGGNQNTFEAWQQRTSVTSTSFSVAPLDPQWTEYYPKYQGSTANITSGQFEQNPQWYRVDHPLESTRGQDTVSYTYSPGFFSSTLNNNNNQTNIIFHVNDINSRQDINDISVDQKINDIVSVQNNHIINRIPDPNIRNNTFVQRLTLATFEFIMPRFGFQTIAAGYPWFSDWGRDTFIAFDGLLATGMFKEAESILLAFGKFEDKGRLPNIIHGENAGNYDTVDAPLLYILAVKHYIEHLQNPEFLNKEFKTTTGKRTIEDVILSIVDNYKKGTSNNIRMDPLTGLIQSPPHFTWMDTNYPAATSREGYTVENNARWFDVLNWVSETFADQDHSETINNIKTYFPKLFINREGQYLYDNLNASYGKGALEAERDGAVRPNQLIAVVSDYGLLEPELMRAIVTRTERELLIPGAIRTLAPDSFSTPEFPYAGHYIGPETNSAEGANRKKYYHNGTAWPHLFGDFARAYIKAFGSSKEALDRISAYFWAFEQQLKQGGIGSIPEIRDGDKTDGVHIERGAADQAWSVAVPLAAYVEFLKAYQAWTERNKVSDQNSSTSSSQSDKSSDDEYGGIYLSSSLLDSEIIDTGSANADSTSVFGEKLDFDGLVPTVRSKGLFLMPQSP